MEWTPWLFWLLSITAAILTSLHVLLRKKDSRSAIAWIGLIWLSPLVGALLYPLFGINRIRRKAQFLRPKTQLPEVTGSKPILGLDDSINLFRLGDKVASSSITYGNKIEILQNGEAAYPAMLESIAQAKNSIALSTYIFDSDSIGRKFVEDLKQACARGVEVRVLVDDFGARYKRPNIDRVLKKMGVPVRRFLPAFSIRYVPFLNLRLHRKLLIVDGKIAFTGGMNIRDGHVVRTSGAKAICDFQFKVEGPVVSELQEIFVEDWEFSSGENLTGDKWFPDLKPVGEVLVRGIADGPEQDYGKVHWMFLGAISVAKHSVRIVTPYFIPDLALITALNVAALRGVKVQILLPEKNNLPWCHWAMRSTIWQVLERGCEIYFTPPPFNHSKLMMMDDHWSFIGSSNWDTRSLRLNFELGLECYDKTLNEKLNAHFDSFLKKSRRITLEEIDRRNAASRIRDGIARLFSPYL